MKKHFIFDLDGTIYRGNHLMPGVGNVIAALHKENHRIVFLSNNPLQSREHYASKLRKLGISVRLPQVITSSVVMGHYLEKNNPGAAVYPIGERPLVKELTRRGLVVSEEPTEIDFVIASFDRDFHYDKLNIAYQAIKNGASFIATNPDKTCPVENGEVPDAAGMIGAIQGVTGKAPELITGKPSIYMIRAALDQLGVNESQCVLVGDRIETDIKMALENEITAVLMLTGVTSIKDLNMSQIKPDYVLDTMEEFDSIIDY